ncbi:uncharacterized protein LOC126668814 [Mercurialis annua]|uniref:uncharacterized protein LOC126668814 n=1 Tax=Mercurialis annua TaxID=3986 RepID=UPI00215EEBF8|nr:uncharacterized protein LOC126668814 [Mercurialis annua]
MYTHKNTQRLKMGLKSRREVESETCLSESLLFATMCLIGLPVDVHVRDGSVYSGIFHTASVDKDYAIVLKEAKLAKKGKLVANVVNGSVIETLVIRSGDLVQVVAKEVLFPSDGVNGNVASDHVEAVAVKVHCFESFDSEAKESNKYGVDKKKINDNRNSAKSKIISADGFVPRKAGKELDGRKVSHRSEIATKVELPKQDVVDVSKSFPDASVSGRQIVDERSQGEHDHHKQKFQLEREMNDDEVQSSSSISSLCLSEAKASEEGQQTRKLLPNGVFCRNSPCSSISTVTSPRVEVTQESHSGALSTSAELVTPQSLESTRTSKDFKLNPGAKIFCPSFATPISANTAAPAVSSMAYVPGNSPMVPAVAVSARPEVGISPFVARPEVGISPFVARPEVGISSFVARPEVGISPFVARPEVGISPFVARPEVGIGPFVARPSVTAKFNPYANLTTVNGGHGPQFSQQVVAHMGNRTQQLRYAGQYHAVQAAPAYVPPNSQAVMIGRLGQVVYMQPIPHDLVHSTASISPVSARPLLTPHHVQYPKHQGSAAGHASPICAPPPLMAGVQQPFAMPNHIPLLQPHIPANCPIPVPGCNGFFATKFQ